MFEWHKKEAPVFTGIARGVGGFGFGKRSGGGSSGPSAFTVTGGSVLETDTHYVHFFTNTGSNPMVVTGTGTIDCLIVGGGAAGGGGCPGGAGGGGAGAVIYKTSVPVTNGTYTLNVGAGGPATPSNVSTPFTPYNGGNTTAFGYTASGGGVGGGGGTNSAGLSGGSGGGGNTFPTPVSAGLPGTGSTGHPGGLDITSPDSGWGNPGGNGKNGPGPAYAGGGGGGAAGAGVNHPSSWANNGLYGKGGDGARYSISGQPLYYSGGGGGGYGEETPGPSLYGGVGGLGGGGSAGRSSNHGSFPNPTFPTSTVGSNATQYGAGGGGHGYTNSPPNGGCGGGGAGYQGVVMVRYPKASSPRSTSSLSASGGNVDGLQPGNGYKYHTFTSPGTFTVSSGATDIEILIVGAGGGTLGSSACCIGHGGGGAGGVLYGALTVTPGPYSVTIGTGSPGSNGGNTSFGSHTALGGGRGGLYTGSSYPGTPGGSGGGAGWSGPSPAWDFYGHRGVQSPSGTLTGYGNPGGHTSDFTGPNSQITNGGGGGAGAKGGDGGNAGAGVGGDGLQFPQFTGSLIGVPALSPLNGYFAGGGGSGVRNNGGGSGGVGGAGGGGAGGPGNSAGTSGTANSGGGGGGPSGGFSDYGATSGGSGIVVVRYKV